MSTELLKTFQLALSHEVFLLKTWIHALTYAASFLWACLFLRMQLQALLLSKNEEYWEVIFSSLRALCVVTLTWLIVSV
jgi:hypothetical protein